MSILSIGKRRKPQLPEISPETRINNAPDVLETINKLEIPREMLIVVGSSALTLLGLDRHAHDVDLVLHPDLLHNLSETHRLPNQTPVVEPPFSHEGFRHFYIDTLPLSTELLSHQLSYAAKSFEDMQQYRTVQGLEGFRIAAPGDLIHHKSSMRMGSRDDQELLRKAAQDKYDIELLKKHLSSQ